MKSIQSRLSQSLTLALLPLLAGIHPLRAQAFTHADSGWVRIFNGKDFTGIYSRSYNQPVSNAVDTTSYRIMYAGTDTAAIYVTPTAKGGNIGTNNTTYSHYRAHVEQLFDALGANNNGGLTYHTDESVIRMSGTSLATGNWPRSIEFQMQQHEPGAAYSIQQCTFDTRVNGGNYAPTGGTAVTVCEHGCNARNYGPSPTIPEGVNNKPRWLYFDLVARGSDTAYHIINDTLVFKLWNIRIYNDAQNGTPNGAYNHGGLGLQSEGSAIKYRRWEIMEFPAATPLTANYLHRLFLDHPDSGESLTAGSTFAVKWRTIGAADIANVSLDYKIGTGAWQSIATNVPNNGSYNWTVPSTPTTALKFRVSGPAWAWADSSRGDNAITTGVGIRVPTESYRPISLTVDGKGAVVSYLQKSSRVEILDVLGHLIRRMKVGDQNLRWDRTNSRGETVQAGLYFIRVQAWDGERTLKLLLN